MFSIRRPTARSIAAFIDAQSESPLSYAPIGLSRKAYDGYNHDVLRQRVGCGERAFAAARAALETWRAFPRGWIEVFPADAPVTPDTTVAVLAHHLGFWSLNACRVVERLGSSGSEFGFAYGTLTQHAESGEERFVVSLDPRDETVWYEIRATSKSRAILARVGYPVSRYFQERFRQESALALREAIGGGVERRVAADEGAESPKAPLGS